ncbi:MAG: transporter substrate-binding domain-containing protein, partial [Oscillospiraceae bacterium]|nr:transporter substrate-binding domain-containing protein [Oscillospiraceae bacterium]
TSVYAAKAQEYGANVTGENDLAQTIQLLLTERIDATLNSHLTYLDYMDANPDAALKVALLAPDADKIAVLVQKGEDTATLREAINKAIAELQEDGTLTDLAIKYFGTDITSAE